MLSNLLCESEGFVKEPNNAMTSKVHHDELNLLHDICDGNIAPQCRIGNPSML